MFPREVSQHVIVCQIVGNCFEATYPIEHFLSEGDSRAESERNPAGALSYQNPWCKITGDSNSLELGGQAWCSSGPVETCNHRVSVVLALHFGNDGFKEISAHTYVAVKKHENGMADHREHIVEIIYLWILADFDLANCQLDWNLREIGLEASDKLDGRVSGIAHTEDDLKFRVILPAQRSIVLVSPEIRPA